GAWLVNQVRRERRRAAHGRRRPAWQPHLRAGRPGVARQEVQEDHFVGAGGAVVMGLKVKKGDTVLVIAGKDKGARGKAIQAYPERSRVLVEGVNRIKKHTKVSTTQRGAKSGGIVTQEAPIHISNVQVVDGDN